MRLSNSCERVVSAGVCEALCEHRNARVLRPASLRPQSSTGLHRERRTVCAALRKHTPCASTYALCLHAGAHRRRGGCGEPWKGQTHSPWLATAAGTSRRRSFPSRPHPLRRSRPTARSCRRQRAAVCAWYARYGHSILSSRARRCSSECCMCAVVTE
jgi:hypothetical protein